LIELNKNQKINELIEISKSNSGVSGPKLAMAHIELGRLLAKEMNFNPNDTTVVAILRGGIFFAQGIYFELGCKFTIYDPKHEEFILPNTKNVIIVDSVINTGNTIKKIFKPGVYIACCVINENAVNIFDDYLYTVRVSKNSFVGSEISKQEGNKGPDTTMRLFNQI